MEQNIGGGTVDPMTFEKARNTSRWNRTFGNKQAPWMENPNPALQIIKFLVLSFIFIAMIFPFVNIVAVSLSSYKDVLGGGLILFPANPTLDAYKIIFEDGSVIRALQVSFMLTIVGTALQVIATVLLAYGLSRPSVPGSRFFCSWYWRRCCSDRS